MTLTKAKIIVGQPQQAELDVHFNPASLRITTTNQLSDGNPNQASKPTSYKLDVELLFDTTESGHDIYRVTRPLRWAAIATARGGTDEQRRGSEEELPRDLSRVAFQWGATIYLGYVESLNETIDYWSSDGVPLRSTIQLSIKGFTDTFVHGEYLDVENYTETNPLPPVLGTVPIRDALDSDRVFTAASQSGGGRSTGRGLAALNGAENMRTGAGAFAGASAGAGAAGAGAGVAAGAGVSLQAAAGFKLSGGISAGASAGFGIGASAGLSASAGIGASVGVGMAAGAGIGLGAGASAGLGGGIGAGAGVGAGAAAGFGASAGFSASAGAGIGAGQASASFSSFSTTSSSVQTGSASAGMSASAGAFAGLGGSAGTSLPSSGFNPNRLLPRPAVSTSSATFDLSGRAIGGGTAVAASWSYSETTAG